jgi:hypothetical protein
MTDEPALPRRTEEEEFRRVIYGHMDAIRIELRDQDERLDRLYYMIQGINESLDSKVDFASLVYAWIGGGAIGAILGFMLGWSL